MRVNLGTMYRQIIATAVLIFTASCAVQGVDHAALAGNTLSAESVLEASPLASLAGSETDLSGFDMLDVSPEMAAFLRAKVDSSDGQNEQLKQLAWAIMRSGEFSLVYDDLTGTATETFNRRRGNCMAFTNMFIALARELGLDARFQEVDVPPNWSMSRGSFLYSQHINVFIDLKQGRSREVDFNIYDFDHELDSRIISDQRARAHYFNNIGAEQMLNGETGLAYAQFRQSLRHDDTYAPAWINMGILHRREGQADYAEVSFLEALRHDHTPQLDVSRLTRDAGWLPPRQDDNSLVAMSNLANLYEEQGETELAAAYFEKVHAHRMKNPYYRYQMAELAFAEGDYEAAIGDLKYAIRRRKNENEFYYLLSLSYLMEGDRKEAMEWMQKAEDVAQLNSEKQRYSHKLDLLQSLNKD